MMSSGSPFTSLLFGTKVGSFSYLWSLDFLILPILNVDYRGQDLFYIIRRKRV